MRKERWTFEQTENGLRYTLPPRRQRGSLLAAPFFLVLLAASLWLKIADPKHSFPVVYLLLCVCFGLPVLYSWLSQIAGKELVTLTPRTLKIERRVFGLELICEYDVARIANVRVTPPFTDWRKWGGFDGGVVAFEYGEETVRFASGLHEAEAATIAGEIKRRYGFGESSSTTGQAAPSHGSPMSSPREAR
ncbi:MAG TPA: hypothetical protein VI670_12605 [Thermoanaerobaculia bacterium]|jgi:hypothetical protein